MGKGARDAGEKDEQNDGRSEGREGEKKGADGFVKFPFCLRTYQISVIPLVVE